MTRIGTQNFFLSWSDVVSSEPPRLLVLAEEEDAKTTVVGLANKVMVVHDSILNLQCQFLPSHKFWNLKSSER